MKDVEVIHKIISTFPEIKKDMEDENDLFHMQISSTRSVGVIR